MTTLQIPNRYINLPEKVGHYSILGLAGVRKAGKDFSADILKKMDPRFTGLSFALHLKELYAKEFKIDLEELVNVKYKEKHRRGLQTYSTQMKKENGEFVFVNALLSQLETTKYYVISDVRFLCELQTITLLGGVTYKVHADNSQRSHRGWFYDPVIDEDVSETELGTLSGDTFYKCCKGGLIFNTKDDAYVAGQLQDILTTHFPMNSLEEYKKLQKIHEMDL